MPELGAIFFDVDDTLYSTSTFAARARRNAVEAMVAAGLDVSVDAGVAELADVVREFSSNYGHHYDKLVLRLSRSLRPGVHPALIVAAGVIAYHRTKDEMAPFDDAEATLKALSKSGILLGVISNGLTVKQAEKLLRLHLEKYFESSAIFISEEIGVAKPHPKIFLLACESVGVDPKNALYIGDNPKKDIDSAHDAGLHTCWRKGSGKHALGLEPEHADLVVDDLREMIPWLEEVFGVDCG
ncbi:MAG: TIGR02253 family HAD-type hydrolase [Planctomycetota bacterium]